MMCAKIRERIFSQKIRERIEFFGKELNIWERIEFFPESGKQFNGKRAPFQSFQESYSSRKSWSPWDLGRMDVRSQIIRALHGQTVF